ncbi:uncharacterized protein RCC_09094 [Ramularia collo-cygni]|uniref:Uncharacterized protein n=1 Tax=Ramularia collo-cygni TaxID=112498 RepID=A0A2D3V8X9_9PEZI|nr:uncharacterized protein RCC_09094 [Ramularia collo-cygni]CZT23380.1 uncharacterized protein RCC_09094 [Ramularia collo-cygni]
MEPEINGVPVISYEKSFAAIKGSGQLVPEQLLLSTMTLCNAIPRLVAYSSEKENYDDYELQHWQLISEALVAVLPTCEAKVDHVEVLPNVLRQKIESGLSSEDLGPSPFLQKGSARSEDLNLLLEYLAATAFLAGVPPERVSLSLGPALRIAKFAHDFVQH